MATDESKAEQPSGFLGEFIPSIIPPTIFMVGAMLVNSSADLAVIVANAIIIFYLIRLASVLNEINQKLKK